MVIHRLKKWHVRPILAGLPAVAGAISPLATMDFFAAPPDSATGGFAGQAVADEALACAEGAFGPGLGPGPDWIGGGPDGPSALEPQEGEEAMPDRDRDEIGTSR